MRGSNYSPFTINDQCWNFRERCEEIHNAFEDLPGMKLNGDRISPVKHLVLRSMSASREEDKAVVNEIVERVR